MFFGCSGDGGFNDCCLGARSGDGGFMLASISGCSGVVGFNVARRRVLCVKKFAQHGLIVGVSVKKFVLRAQNGPKSVFSGVLGEFCRGRA